MKTGCLILIALFCLVIAQDTVEVNGPLYAVGIAPTDAGISFNTYDLTSTGDNLVGFAEIANEEGGSWADSARLALDRARGMAYVVAVARSGAWDQTGRNVTMFKYRYIDAEGNFMKEPEELTRCRFPGDIFMLTELFLNSRGEIFGVLRINGFPAIIKIQENCNFDIVKEIPSPATRIAYYAAKDYLYFPTNGGLNQIDLNNMHSTLFLLPLTNRRWGLASFIALDQNTGTIYMTNTNGNFGDRRWFVFEQGTQTVKLHPNTRPGLTTGSIVEVFNVNGQPIIASLTGRRWLGSDPVSQRVEAWSSSGSLNAPERADWRLHHLNTQ